MAELDILNGLRWTEALDEQFKRNHEKDPQILWQFFGSQTGLMRSYPASSWDIEPDEVDLFDVRRQAWYVKKQDYRSMRLTLCVLDRMRSHNN